MLEILIISAIITAKLTAVDRQYAKQGLTPPGYRLIDKWLDGRKARGQAPASAKPAKYGMWRYFWQRWQAMWELQSLQAEQRHQQRLQDRRDGKPGPRKLGWKEQAAADWQWFLDHVVEPVGEKQPVADQRASDVSYPAATSEDPVVADGPRIACPDCGQTLIDRDGQWQHPSSAGCPNQPALTTPDPTESQPEPNTAAAPADGDHPSEGEPAMTQATQQSGEVVGLMSAIHYATEVAGAHAAHSSGGGEGYRASLAAAEVGPETIQSAAEAQEASANAAGAWQRHAEKLREQLAAKEATTAETGRKEFLLNE